MSIWPKSWRERKIPDEWGLALWTFSWGLSHGWQGAAVPGNWGGGLHNHRDILNGYVKSSKVYVNMFQSQNAFRDVSVLPWCLLPCSPLPCTSPLLSLAGLSFGVSFLKYKQIATVSILPPFLIHRRLSLCPFSHIAVCQASALRSRVWLPAWRKRALSSRPSFCLWTLGFSLGFGYCRAAIVSLVPNILGLQVSSRQFIGIQIKIWESPFV